MSEMVLRVEPREETGKSANRKLRSEGWIPAVVYGGDRDAVSIQVEKTRFLDLIRGAGEHSVFLLRLGDSDKQRHTMIRNVDADPVSRRVIHIDFQRVRMDEKVRLEIPVELVGEPEGVRTEGGVLDFITREVEIECLPGKIPGHLEFDVTELKIGDHAELGDIELPEGVELLSEPDRVLAAVAHARVEAEPEEEEDDFLLEAEGAEPEVIGKGRDEDEESGAGDESEDDA